MMHHKSKTLLCYQLSSKNALHIISICFLLVYFCFLNSLEEIAVPNDTSQILNVSKFIGLGKCTVNTKKWLLGPRLGNVHHELDGYDYLVKQMLLVTTNIFKTYPIDKNKELSLLLAQTICLPQSQFRNISKIPSVTRNEELTNRHWTVKLIYLSLHYHQHKYALPEAEQRYSTSIAPHDCLPVTQTELSNKYGVGRFDYECPNAKFLVISLHQVGLGANIRTGVVPAMMLGLMTDRVVLLINNVPKSVDVPNQMLHENWPLVSCPRQDYQCFFWPTSPCVLTEDDITNAYALNLSESRGLRDNFIPKYADHHKVWFWDTELLPINDYHAPSADKLYEYALKLISVIPEVVTTDIKDLFMKAAEQIHINDGFREPFHYTNSKSKVQHTVSMFMLRPLPKVSKILETKLSEIIPVNFNPAHSIGLPIRASDKCDKESECLTFNQHMIVAGEMWEKYLNRTISIKHNKNHLQPFVVFTTEATSMVDEQKAFVNEDQGVSRYPDYNFTFITNHHDVTPNSGFMSDSRRSQLHDSDTLMMSVLSTLKTQLLPQVTVTNCCSGFHQLINDLLLEGCGWVEANTNNCLQDTADPWLVPCCGHHIQCVERKKKIMEIQQKDTSPDTF